SSLWTVVVVGPGHALFAWGHTDRPMVVLHQEHHRSVPHRGEVVGLVGITFTDGTITQNRQCRHVVTPAPGRIGQLDRVRGVGGRGHALRGTVKIGRAHV